MRRKLRGPAAQENQHNDKHLTAWLREGLFAGSRGRVRHEISASPGCHRIRPHLGVRSCRFLMPYQHLGFVSLSSQCRHDAYCASLRRVTPTMAPSKFLRRFARHALMISLHCFSEPQAIGWRRRSSPMRTANCVQNDRPGTASARFSPPRHFVVLYVRRHGASQRDGTNTQQVALGGAAHQGA